jgi:RimJ/RimL family protein N-acetyltransferase
MRVYLETERLVLRQFSESDVDRLCDLDSDPDVMRFINGGVATPRAVIQSRILPRFMDFYRQYEALGVWAAHERSRGDFIGWFALHPEDGRDPDDLALGYRLRKASWRKGFASEGAKALVDKAFRDLGARRVFACTYSDNVASRKVMERCGLRHVRTYRMTADEIASAPTSVATDAVWPNDDVEYALERTEWADGLPLTRSASGTSLSGGARA